MTRCCFNRYYRVTTVFLNFSTKYLLRVHKRLQAHFLCWVLPNVHSLQMIKYSPKAINSIDWETDYTRWSSVELSKLFESLCYCLSRSVIEGCFVVRKSGFESLFSWFYGKGIARGVLGCPWPSLLQAFFNQTTYNRWRKCHDDTQVIETICWVTSLWHSVTPPLLWKILAMPLELPT